MRINYIAVIAEQFIVCNMLFRLAVYASVGHKAVRFQRQIAVIQRMHDNIIAVKINSRNAVCALLNLVYIRILPNLMAIGLTLGIGCARFLVTKIKAELLPTISIIRLRAIIAQR